MFFAGIEGWTTTRRGVSASRLIGANEVTISSSTSVHRRQRSSFLSPSACNRPVALWPQARGEETVTPGRLSMSCWPGPSTRPLLSPRALHPRRPWENPHGLAKLCAQVNSCRDNSGHTTTCFCCGYALTLSPILRLYAGGYSIGAHVAARRALASSRSSRRAWLRCRADTQRSSAEASFSCSTSAFGCRLPSRVVICAVTTRSDRDLDQKRNVPGVLNVCSGSGGFIPEAGSFTSRRF